MAERPIKGDFGELSNRTSNLCNTVANTANNEPIIIPGIVWVVADAELAKARLTGIEKSMAERTIMGDFGELSNRTSNLRNTVANTTISGPITILSTVRV